MVSMLTCGLRLYQPQPTDDNSVSAYTYVEAFNYGDAPITYGSVSHVVDVTKDLANNTYNKFIFLGAFVGSRNCVPGICQCNG